MQNFVAVSIIIYISYYLLLLFKISFNIYSTFIINIYYYLKFSRTFDMYYNFYLQKFFILKIINRIIALLFNIY